MQLKKQFLESILSFNVFENHDLSFKVNTYDQSESGKSKLMVTNTKIQRNNLSFSHAFKTTPKRSLLVLIREIIYKIDHGVN